MKSEGCERVDTSTIYWTELSRLKLVLGGKRIWMMMFLSVAGAAKRRVPQGPRADHRHVQLNLLEYIRLPSCSSTSMDMHQVRLFVPARVMSSFMLCHSLTGHVYGDGVSE